MAACGTPLLAARGGRVQYSGYQGAAGNYVVIDGKSTGKDFVYMHLIRPSPLREGQVVRTASRSATSARPATRPGATCTSRCGPRPAGTRAAISSTRRRTSKRWDRYS